MHRQPNTRTFSATAWAARLVLAAAFCLASCGALRTDAHLAAFSSQLTGMNQVPPVPTSGSARVVAVLDKNKLLFRWKVPAISITGAVTAIHFHGPAKVGANADAVLKFKLFANKPLGDQATVSAAQASDLLAGRWYVTFHTSTHPSGEIRGQLMLRE